MRYKFKTEYSGSLWRSLLLLTVGVALIALAPLPFKLLSTGMSVLLVFNILAECGFINTWNDRIDLRGAKVGSIKYTQIEALEDKADIFPGVWKYVLTEQQKYIFGSRLNPLICLRLKEPKWFFNIVPIPFPWRTRFVKLSLQSIEDEERLANDLSERMKRAEVS